MGGFREFMNSQKQQSTAWDEEPKHSEEQEEPEVVAVEEEEDEITEDEFTMEIMLRMAGVEEKLLGWDRELNKMMGWGARLQPEDRQQFLDYLSR